MAFRKTSIALSNRVLPSEETKEILQTSQLPGDQPPLDPKVGDMWEGMVWDGGAWVTQALWAKTKAQG